MVLMFCYTSWSFSLHVAHNFAAIFYMLVSLNVGVCMQACVMQFVYLSNLSLYVTQAAVTSHLMGH